MKVGFRLVGERPLLMHSARLSDPLNDDARRVKEIKAKRKRTEADEEAAALLEWQAGMYHDPDVGPFIPGQNIEAMLKQAARIMRKGKDVERAILVTDAMIPLLYDGPRDLAGLKSDVRFRHSCSARMPSTGARVWRVRAIFPEWEAEGNLILDDMLLDYRDLQSIILRAGGEIGLGDWRPRYGAFTGEVFRDGDDS